MGRLLQKALFVFGTRPEVIKLAPLIRELRTPGSNFVVEVCVTGQHRELLDQALQVFGLRPQHDLRAMVPAQGLAAAAGRILSALAAVLERSKPDLVIVQGDTTSTLCGALAGFYGNARVIHVEAGLRTGDRGRPFPEEIHRVLAGRMADLHLAATGGAASNLLSEGVAPDSIVTTGNTAIDALLDVAGRLESGAVERPCWPWLDSSRKLLLLTAHRRESFGSALDRICRAALELSRRQDVQIAWPVHPNPNVRRTVEQRLGGCARVHLLEPLDYVQFVDLMLRSTVILTDSGGVQEEAPSLGKPVLVLRETTERPEGIEAGASRLVGASAAKIIAETELLLDDPVEYADRAQVRHVFGDGQASRRIAAALARFDERGRFAAVG